MLNTQAILLAAGKSTRLQTGNTKLVEKICGQEVILYPLELMHHLELESIVVLGHQQDLIKDIISSKFPGEVQFVTQYEQKGTAHAVRLTKELLTSDYILILKGDMPLITQELLNTLYREHITSNAEISFVWTHNSDPTGFPYNRVLQLDEKPYIKAADSFTKQELFDHCCITTGIYLINKNFLLEAIEKVQCNEFTNEYDLSELVNIASNQNKKVTMVSSSFDIVRSIKTYQDLWAIEQIKRSELIKFWMKRGVRFHAAQSVHMDIDVEIGAGTFIGCSVHLQHGTKIGSNCTLEPFAILDNATVGNNVTVYSHTVVRNASIGDNSKVGPFAHIQEQTIIGQNARVGNFVETKRTTIGNNSKAKHLAYLGDALIGSYVNIGAGTITCNYDGKNKHTTIIKDHVFIGTNNSLIAPVTIHENAFTAAGSTITEDVPANALAIARAKQVNKEEYAQKLQSDDSSETKNERLSFIAAQREKSTLNSL